MARTDYTPEQITLGLMAVAAHGGDCTVAGEELLDDEFQVPVATLRRWITQTHAERYKQIVQEHGHELEQHTVEILRGNAKKAAEIERDLLDDMKTVPLEQKPQALRAVADVKAKSVDKLLALTGRPTDGAPPSDLPALLRSMAAKGVVKLNVNLDVDSTAVEDEPAQLEEGQGS